MTTRTPARRPGLSLLEVIVALFVMALGMISLLTLFPLGAYQMAQALQDARAAETASQADTHMRLWWQKYVVERPGLEDPAFGALDDWKNSDPIGTVPAQVIPSTSIDASYPLAIDPIGWQARIAFPSRYTLARPGGGQVPRRTMNWITTQPDGNTSGFSFLTATMMDDVVFNEVATPDTTASGAGAQMVRIGRYNWSAIIQRPVNSNRYVADLKILVFHSRSPGAAPADSELVLTPAFAANVGTSQIILNVGTAVPNPADFLRAGNWIMDGTIDPNVAANRRNAVWYRIQAIDKDTFASAGQWIVDLETPLVRPITVAPTTPATQIYAFKGLMEVFDRPQLAPPGYKKQQP